MKGPTSLQTAQTEWKTTLWRPFLLLFPGLFRLLTSQTETSVQLLEPWTETAWARGGTDPTAVT